MPIQPLRANVADALCGLPISEVVRKSLSDESHVSIELVATTAAYESERRSWVHLFLPCFGSHLRVAHLASKCALRASGTSGAFTLTSRSWLVHDTIRKSSASANSTRGAPVALLE